MVFVIFAAAMLGIHLQMSRRSWRADRNIQHHRMPRACELHCETKTITNLRKIVAHQMRNNSERSFFMQQRDLDLSPGKVQTALCAVAGSTISRGGVA